MDGTGHLDASVMVSMIAGMMCRGCWPVAKRPFRFVSLICQENKGTNRAPNKKTPPFSERPLWSGRARKPYLPIR